MYYGLIFPEVWILIIVYRPAMYLSSQNTSEWNVLSKKKKLYNNCYKYLAFILKFYYMLGTIVGAGCTFIIPFNPHTNPMK